APGDRVLIGATILKLSQSLSAPGTEPTLEVGREEVADPEPSRISGTLTEQGLTKVLETHAADGQDVSIELRLDGVPGFVAIHAGRIWDCGLESLAAGPPVKALFRMLSAPRGEYYVRPGSEPDVPRLDYDVAALLVESKRAGDELDVLRQRLPSAEEAVAMPRPLIAPLVALDEVDLTLLQVAHNQRKVGKIIDASRLVDHEVVRRLLGLIDRGYLRKA
ncbi:MAG: DUF4388 domain-containing protein, partial [Deltaproteobacteria bacterium]|nr:DUF4388 domain-containing protein [Deltaproteobacteria bacterium]